MYKRQLEQQISHYLNGKDKKILFIWGPRRSGKTTMIKKIGADLGLPVFNFDLMSDYEKFAPDVDVLRKVVASCPVVLIDEVQNYPEATKALKVLHDEFAIKIIATGSSELRQKTTNFDSLAGRFAEHFCLPLSIGEIHNNFPLPAHEEEKFFVSLAEKIQIYGAYPEVFNNTLPDSEKIDALQNILDTYVLKDVIDIYNLRNAKLAKDILTKIALQIGSEVSLRELASDLGANVVTVSNYIEIFIKNYVLLPLPAFKTNLRRAVSAHRKFYFLDLGLRNILVKDFRDTNIRPDRGGLFENFVMAEMYKKIKNGGLHYSLYFYREYGGKEIDFVVEDYKKNYTCFEAKFSGGGARPVFPLAHKQDTINTRNYVQKLNLLK